MALFAGDINVCLLLVTPLDGFQCDQILSDTLY